MSIPIFAKPRLRFDGVYWWCRRMPWEAGGITGCGNSPWDAYKHWCSRLGWANVVVVEMSDE